MTHAAAQGTQSPEFDTPTDAQITIAARRFAMLADPTRLRLLGLMSGRELDVTTLAELGATTPTVASQHLAKLRLAGLVEHRADGK
jgi:DNA-binding transcriptional ArsR family regulator